MPQIKMPPAVLLALTLGPALAIGMTLWIVNDIIPECMVTEHQRVTAPDDQFDLVVFSRECGPTPPNTQAALVPPGEAVPFDAASFFSIPAAADLAASWGGDGSIEIDAPEDVEALRRDATVAGVTVIYR